MTKKKLNRYLIFNLIVFICIGCYKTIDTYPLYLKNWNEYKYEDNHVLGNLLFSYSFNHKYSKKDSCANVYIYTCNEKLNDTIIVFDINCTSNIDTITCSTCKDIFFDIIKMSSIPKALKVPLNFEKSKFNNSQKYKYVFGKNIVNIID